MDGPFRYLVPLNPNYKMLEVNGNCRIVGVVKQVIMDL
ncbi:SOS-response repressor and protease [Yersinia phage YeP2]|nr:SOS-response repressor and protease [Yersinia phage YeP2]